MQTVVPNLSLAEFDRHHQPPAATRSSRAIAALLTTVLGALTMLLAAQNALWTIPDQPMSSEVITSLVPDPPHKKVILPPPPFVTIRFRLHAEKPAPPVFTVASETPPAPAALPASAAQSTPLAGGITEGMGTGPQSVSANGTNGNGKGLSACWDAAYGKAVHDRIAHFYYDPRRPDKRAAGMVMVHMMVRHNGLLDLVEVLQSSGDKSLDYAAYNMVRKAQPLPTIPDRMHADRIDAEMAIFFGTPGASTPTPGNCN